VSTLIVATPSLQAELSGPGVAVLEKPVTLVSPAVTLPDGTPLTDQTPGVVAGFFLFRRKGSTVTEVWDETAKAWRVLADALVMALKPKPLAYKKESGTWEGLFVASTDKGAVETGATDYLFRTFFQVPSGGTTLGALSSATPALHFVAMIDAAQGGLKVVPPEGATEVLLFLRDASKQLIGSVRMVNESGRARIELVGAGGAFVRLTSLGDIELQSATNRHIFHNGIVVA
jgi:hypothetical protein